MTVNLMDENSINLETPSPFYFACRNNEITLVRRLLDEYPLETLDKMEPNGSTALHAACYYKCIDVIKLLLDRGFTRRVLNRFHQTPFDESETEEIQQLFTRPRTSNRFGGDISYEQERMKWILINSNEQNITQDRPADSYNGNRLEYGIFHGNIILQQIGLDMPKIDVIRRLFNRAMNENDFTRLIQAYTAETDFYNRINNYLLSRTDETNTENQNSSNVISQFTDTICFNRQLHEEYSFQGICYRSIKITSDTDLNMYKVGTKIINRTFISATKERQFAEQYVCERNQNKKYAVIISYMIRLNNTALDIECLSEFPLEKEVLIMNNSIFKVIRITTKSNFDVEIELRQSRSTRVDQKEKQSSGLFGIFYSK